MNKIHPALNGNADLTSSMPCIMKYFCFCPRFVNIFYLSVKKGPLGFSGNCFFHNFMFGACYFLPLYFMCHYLINFWCYLSKLTLNVIYGHKWGAYTPSESSSIQSTQTHKDAAVTLWLTYNGCRVHSYTPAESSRVPRILPSQKSWCCMLHLRQSDSSDCAWWKKWM